MDLKSQIISRLKNYSKKTIDFFSLQSMSDGKFEKQELETVIKELMADQILILLSKKPDITISSKFRLDKTRLYQEELNQIRALEWRLDNRIHLDYYYKYPVEMASDEEVLLKINRSIQEETIFEELYLPELSLRLVGDEKWLEYKEGKKLLKKIGLWEHFTVGDRYEPIAFALNPMLFGGQETNGIYRHLIVENKTTFKQVMNILARTEFAAVIYGQGYKIISSCRMLKEQLPLKGQHQFEYFGDFDKKGIEIFDALTGQMAVTLHQGLYEALFKKGAVRGHESQNCAQEKIERFCGQFVNAKELLQLIENGLYLPQEMLSEQEMERVLNKG